MASEQRYLSYPSSAGDRRRDPDGAPAFGRIAFVVGSLEKCVTFSAVRFEWDPRKAQINKRKHDVTFEEAAECFADPLAMIVEEHDHPDRLVLIGQSQSYRLIFTVYAERASELIRIVTDRQGTAGDPNRTKEI